MAAGVRGGVARNGRPTAVADSEVAAVQWLDKRIRNRAVDRAARDRKVTASVGKSTSAMAHQLARANE